MLTGASNQRAGRMNGARDGHSSLGTWAAWCLPCLAAGWLATAALYTLSIRRLPEPPVGAVTATLTAMLLAGVLTAWVLAAGPEPAPNGTWLPEAPEPPTVRVTDRMTRPAAPLDLSAYERPAHALRQCPRCGSFHVSSSDGAEPQSNACQTCGDVWRSGGGLPEPDVVVRSWLHH
jgi:hypothetical protein